MQRIAYKYIGVRLAENVFKTNNEKKKDVLKLQLGAYDAIFVQSFD